MTQSQTTAEKSVKLAADFFRKKGFSIFKIRRVVDPGPDLFIEKKGYVYTVEVKTVKVGKKEISINKCYNKSSELIALVFPSGRVVIDTMRNHIKCCNSSGTRGVSSMSFLMDLGVL